MKLQFLQSAQITQSLIKKKRKNYSMKEISILVLARWI